MALGLSSLIFMFQRSHASTAGKTSLQLSENITLFVVCRIYTGGNSRDLDRHQMFGVHHLYTDGTMWGAGWNLVAPLLAFPLA
jgi:hypothetical protein